MVLSKPSVRQRVLNRVVQEIDDECMSVCRRQPVLVFRKITPLQMESFSWDCYIKELETKCPILYQILETVVSHSDRRNSQKKGEAHHPGICMVAAVLLKERNREMVGVQSLLSLVLPPSSQEREFCSVIKMIKHEHVVTHTLPSAF